MSDQIKDSIRITIKKGISLDDLSNYTKQLAELISKGKSVDLEIPTKPFLCNNFGFTYSFTKFVFNWVASKSSGRLILSNHHNWINSKTEARDLFKNESLFLSLVLCYKNLPIYLGDTLADTNQVKIWLNTAFFAMKKGGVITKNRNSVSQFCFDHLPQRRGILGNLEGPTKILSESDFSSHNQPRINVVFEQLSGIEGFRDILHNKSNDLTGILYELYKNTYEWGRQDLNHTQLLPSIRGFNLKFHSFELGKNIETFSIPPVLKYLKNNILPVHHVPQSSIEKFDEETKLKYYFLEINVLDCGLGFIEQFKHKAPNNLSHKKIIEQCLKKHSTSETGVENSLKGRGLDRILSTISPNGFLFIHTNGRSFYRDLLDEPYDSERGNTELVEYSLESEAIELNRGTLITILLPVR